MREQLPHEVLFYQIYYIPVNIKLVGKLTNEHCNTANNYF